MPQQGYLSLIYIMSVSAVCSVCQTSCSRKCPACSACLVCLGCDTKHAGSRECLLFASLQSSDATAADAQSLLDGMNKQELYETIKLVYIERLIDPSARTSVVVCIAQTGVCDVWSIDSLRDRLQSVDMAWTETVNECKPDQFCLVVLETSGNVLFLRHTMTAAMRARMDSDIGPNNLELFRVHREQHPSTA
jgi:hypothetical protein